MSVHSRSGTCRCMSQEKALQHSNQGNLSSYLLLLRLLSALYLKAASVVAGPWRFIAHPASSAGSLEVSMSGSVVNQILLLLRCI